MRTAAQQEASRRNGARSRGPVTDAGKNRIRFNALKHGLTALHVCLKNEPLLRFEEFFHSILATMPAANDLEFMAVQEYAWAKWRYRRALQQETNLLDQPASADQSRDLRNTQTYLLRCRREFESALREFERLAKLRDHNLIEPLEPETPSKQNLIEIPRSVFPPAASTPSTDPNNAPLDPPERR